MTSPKTGNFPHPTFHATYVRILMWFFDSASTPSQFTVAGTG